MCGIIAYQVKEAKGYDLGTIKRLFVESQIRGKHATGIAWIDDGKIYGYIMTKPAEEFVKEFDFRRLIASDGSLTMIGHTRYSTSDLQYNQPLYNGKFALVHNGVMTQELPEHWEELFGCEFLTKNDSEILFKYLEQQSESEQLDIYPDASIAYASLSIEHGLRYGRNGLRPLWHNADERANRPLGFGREAHERIVVASTHNIGQRVGVPLCKVEINTLDLQP